MEYFKVNNLEKYQKLTKTTRYAIIEFKILSDYKFKNLSNLERLLWIGCILIACMTQNHVPYDAKYVAETVLKMSRGYISGTLKALKKFQDLELISPISYCATSQIDREIYRKKEDINLKDETSSKREELRKFVKGGFKVKTFKEA